MRFTHQQARTLLFCARSEKTSVPFFAPVVHPAPEKTSVPFFAPVVQGVGGRVTLEPRAYGGETLRTQS